MKLMAVFSSVEEAREYFKGDRFATENGVVLEELGDGYSICSLTLSERNQNANGGVMGGAIYTLADLCFAAAANNRHRPTVTQQVSVNYLRAPKGIRLLAKAVCKKDGKTSCVYNVDVLDDLGNEVAQFVGVGFKLF